jgi:hypothetical protein
MFETCFEIFPNLSLSPSFLLLKFGGKKKRSTQKKKGKQAKRPNRTPAAHLAHPSSCRHRPRTAAHPCLHVAIASDETATMERSSSLDHPLCAKKANQRARWFDSIHCRASNHCVSRKKRTKNLVQFHARNLSDGG